jgi:hypothetical protein
VASAAKQLLMKRALDFVLYALIGVALYLGVLWFAIEGGQRDSLGKWGGLALFTAVLFGSVIVSKRQSIRRLLFWAALFVVFAIHLALFAVVLRQVNEWRAIWWALLYPFENVAIDAVLRCWASMARLQYDGELEYGSSAGTTAGNADVTFRSPRR